ncbi:MAG: hypothetical protein LBD44_06655, partial [Spirochaetaceae bacterium]|nr:hypothetical protein [Spirochaetaceae bacterium]
AKSVCRLLQIRTEQLIPLFNGIINELCLDRVTVSLDIDGEITVEMEDGRETVYLRPDLAALTLYSGAST